MSNGGMHGGGPGVLAADGVTFSYPGRGLSTRPRNRVLQGVSLHLTPGSSTALVGSSGSGKSTLVRVLLALAKPSGGTVTLEGRPVQPAPARTLRWYRRRVQYVPQDPAGSLDPRMTVGQLLAEPLRQLRVDGNHKALAAEALDRVKVPAAMLHQRPGELSGGQKQRVAIARALVVSPSYLLADEPVSGLDLPLRETVLGLLNGLVRDGGMGLLLVTHDLMTAARMCDSTAVLSGGRVVEQGPTRRVLREPSAQATAAMLAAAHGVEQATVAAGVPAG